MDFKESEVGIGKQYEKQALSENSDKTDYRSQFKVVY